MRLRLKFQNYHLNEDVLGCKLKLTKDGSLALLINFTYFFNKSILNRHIPAEWKYTLVISICKRTATINDPCDYRPIYFTFHMNYLHVTSQPFLFCLMEHVSLIKKCFDTVIT